MSNIWRANYLSIKTKLRIFNACVISMLLHGCETWYVTRNIGRKLQSFINRHLRSILRIWWPKIISNEDLWKLTESGDIIWRLDEENLDGSDTHTEKRQI
jgi:hypothetical protein